MLLTALGDAMQQKLPRPRSRQVGRDLSAAGKESWHGRHRGVCLHRAEPLPDYLAGRPLRLHQLLPARSPQTFSLPCIRSRSARNSIFVGAGSSPPVQAPERQAGPSAETRTPTSIQNALQLSQALSLVRQSTLASRPRAWSSRSKPPRVPLRVPALMSEVCLWT